jgi:hypothetical protein
MRPRPESVPYSWSIARLVKNGGQKVALATRHPQVVRMQRCSAKQVHSLQQRADAITDRTAYSTHLRSVRVCFVMSSATGS